MLLTFTVSQALAFEGKIGFFVFENKGRSSYFEEPLRNRETLLRVEAPWFTWKCYAFKDVDGAVVHCDRNKESVEAKAFCRDLTETKDFRALRVGDGPNFVTFEITCEKEVVKQPVAKVKAPAKSKTKKQPKASPPTITTPQAPVTTSPAAPQESSAPTLAPIPPELPITPPPSQPPAATPSPPSAPSPAPQTELPPL